MLHETEIATTAVLSSLFTLLAIAIATDIKSNRIPNLLLAPALSFALLLQTLIAGPSGLLAALGGLCVGLAMLMPLYAMGGMGAGDVKLLGVVGSFLGPWGALAAGAATLIAGAILGLGIIFVQRVWPLLQAYAANFLGAHSLVNGGASITKAPTNPGSKVTRIAYAPAIATGTLASLFYIGYLPT